ncbi:MAG: ABC transporter permease, partial [Pseudomonadota bacterium]
VTFPGIMTGQLLANADPLQAAKYQMLVMFMIAGSSSLAIVATAYAMLYRITDARHRLRLDRLR